MGKSMTRLIDLKNTIPLSDLDRDLAKEVQECLVNLGYLDRVDGIIGPKTLVAFAQFKNDNYLTEPTLLGSGSAKILIEKSQKHIVFQQNYNVQPAQSLKYPKIAIDLGHGCKPDSGAVGILSEEYCIESVGKLVISQLENLGYQIILCRPSFVHSVRNSLSFRCNTANKSKADLFISIHFNAFNGAAHGSEVYAISKTGKQIARKILDGIVSMGYRDRGVKAGSRLHVLRNTKMVALLIEGCFIDSQKDINLFNPEVMANAIVKGIHD